MSAARAIAARSSRSPSLVGVASSWREQLPRLPHRDGRRSPRSSASASTCCSASPVRCRSATSASTRSAPTRCAILTTTLRLEFLARAAARRAASRGVVGALLAMPALRVRGPYLAMVTIAFGFVVENASSRWEGLTGGQNGIMNIPCRRSLAARWASAASADRDHACSPCCSCCSNVCARSAWGLRCARCAIRNRGRVDRPRSACAIRTVGVHDLRLARRRRRRVLRRRCPTSSAPSRSRSSSRSCSCSS